MVPAPRKYGRLLTKGCMRKRKTLHINIFAYFDVEFRNVCVCVCVLHINLSGPNHSAVADPARGLLHSREKSNEPKTKKRTSYIEKNKPRPRRKKKILIIIMAKKKRKTRTKARTRKRHAEQRSVLNISASPPPTPATWWSSRFNRCGGG